MFCIIQIFKIFSSPVTMKKIYRVLQVSQSHGACCRLPSSSQTSFRCAIQATTARAASSAVSIPLSFTDYTNVVSHRPPLKSNVPVIIMHGLFGQKSNWHSIAKALQTKIPHKVVSVDLRDHGESPWTGNLRYDYMAEDVLDVFHRVAPNSSEMILIGHSMGGKVAMQIALNISELVRKLIVEDIAPKKYGKAASSAMGSIPRYIEGMLKVEVPRHSSLPDARRIVDEQLEPYVEDKTTRNWLLLNLYMRKDGTVAWLPNLEGIGSCLRDIHDFNRIPENEKHTRPTLFIAGGKSSYITSEDEPLLSKHFPNHELVTLSDCGHWLHAENPQAFIDTVVKFINF